jgi:hypothetical protein
MTDIYTANSKEVLRNGVHFADAVDDDAAQVIVSAMSELHGLRVQIEVHEKLGPARERQFAKCRDERDTQRAGIIAHLEADATPLIDATGAPARSALRRPALSGLFRRGPARRHERPARPALPPLHRDRPCPRRQ